MVRITTVVLPARPVGWVAQEMAARVRFYGVEGAKQRLAEAERRLLAAKSAEEKTMAERNLLKAHRELAEAREWKG